MQALLWRILYFSVVVATLWWAGCPKTEKRPKTVEELRSRALGGEAECQNELGQLYEYGIAGLPKDGSECVKWYRAAAEQGMAHAQYNLGNCYRVGLGVPKDQTEAILWYRKAAAQSDKWAAAAQVALGWIYENGLGVPVDDGEALRWYTKAAELDDYNGQFWLGVRYAEGKGVVKNEAEARRWYRKAADQGLADAQYNLGDFYAKGIGGVAKDDTQAYKWFLLAGAQGHLRAKSAISLVEIDLTPQQRAEGQKLARDFKPRK